MLHKKYDLGRPDGGALINSQKWNILKGSHMVGAIDLALTQWPFVKSAQILVDVFIPCLGISVPKHFEPSQ